ncbi:MAG TPA: AAA family ATPase [Candidatus Limnocylindrales bacterium]|nr:AAA family ATPase [Candidatus Limnocylindrales bacterium]
MTARPDRERPWSPLAGRQVELATALEALEVSKQEHRFQVVELVGEPGMGKSRLLKEIADRARARLWRVAFGQPTDAGPLADLCQLVDALDDHVTEQDVRDLDRAQPGASGLLATLFPVLAMHRDIGDTGEPGGQGKDLWFMRALRSLLSILAHSSGLALMLDDIHRSDHLTLAVVEYLLRHPPQVPLLLAMAYRPRRANSRMVRALQSATRDGVVCRIVLPPLTAQEAQTLLRPGMRRWQKELAYRRSGGNPAYLEILNAVSKRDGESGTSDELPPAPTAHLLAELQPLSPTGRLVASAAAVAGDEFDPLLVAAIAEVSNADALRGIDEMIQIELIEPMDSPPRFRFRHSLVRQVAYEAAGGGWRLGAHGRAVATLCQRRAPLVAVAYHVGRAAAPGDSTSCDVLVHAARSIMRSEPQQAAEWLESALQLLGAHLEEQTRRLEILELLGTAQVAAGKLALARQTLAKLLQADPARPVATLIAAAEVDLLSGRIGSARDQLVAELTSRAATTDSGHPALLLALSTVTLHEDLPDIKVVRQAFQVADSWAPGVMRAQALAAMAIAGHAIGVPDTATADTAADMVDRLSDHDLAGHLWALIWLARAEIDLERYELARRHAQRGAGIARDTGAVHLLPHLLALATESDLHQGRLAEASTTVAQLEDVVGTFDQLGPLAALHPLLQSRIAAESGNELGAVVTAHHCVEAMSTVEGEPARQASLTVAHAMVSAGRWDFAVRAFLAAGGGPDLPALRLPVRLMVYTELVRAELARGRPQEAHAWLELARDLDLPDLPDLPGLAARLQLAVARTLLRVDPKQAATHARHAADLFTKAGQRIDAGRALLLASMAMHSDGARAAARDMRAEAVQLLTECGAAPLVEAADAEHGHDPSAGEPAHGNTTSNSADSAHAAGHVPRQSPPPLRQAQAPQRQSQPAPVTALVEQPQFATLSGRELQIAELVSRGHTNRQIARMLSLSHKTVETYLARIFTKLGVSSRAAVATLVGRGVLTGGGD